MDYREAADLAFAIRASLTVPLHYDMMKGNGADPDVFGRYMEKAYPGRDYRIMEPGEKIVLHSQ